MNLKEIPDMPHDEPVIFVPDEFIRDFKHTLRKMEASLIEFANVAKEIKPIEKLTINN